MSHSSNMEDEVALNVRRKRAAGWLSLQVSLQRCDISAITRVGVVGGLRLPNISET
jgi:hypothetical protein